jgi:hypothetical protein
MKSWSNITSTIFLGFTNYLLKLSLLVIIILLFLSPIFAQNKSIDARIVYQKAQNEQILIGDKLKLVITIFHNINEQYKLKLDKEGIKFFEIQGEPISNTQLLNGMITQTQIEVNLIPFQTGKLPIPPLTVISNFNEELKTKPLEVEVQTLTQEQDKEIKDIKLIPTPPKNGWLQVAVLGLLLFSAVGYLTLRFINPIFTNWILAYWNKLFPKTPKKEPEIVLPKQSLEDITISKLKALLASDLIYKDLKEFHIQLSEIMTNYAISRYGVEKQEYTTSELLELLGQTGVPILIYSTFEQVLNGCDMVKFAQFIPNIDSARLKVNQAIDLFNSLNYRTSSDAKVGQ